MKWIKTTGLVAVALSMLALSAGTAEAQYTPTLTLTANGSTVTIEVDPYRRRTGIHHSGWNQSDICQHWYYQRTCRDYEGRGFGSRGHLLPSRARVCGIGRGAVVERRQRDGGRLQHAAGGAGR